MARYYYDKYTLKSVKSVNHKLTSSYYHSTPWGLRLYKAGMWSGGIYVPDPSKGYVDYQFDDPDNITNGVQTGQGYSGSGATTTYWNIGNVYDPSTSKRTWSVKKYSMTYSYKSVKDELIEIVSAEDGTYPTNGISGKYWYVKGERAFPDMSVNINGSWKTAQDGWVNINGAWRSISNIWTNINGVWKES